MHINTGRYHHVLQQRAFRLFWITFTLSALGDAITRVSLTWFVWEETHSSEALGLLALTYTGPVILGGLAAGPILDRFDRRHVMMIDSLFRGAVILTIPLLHTLDALALWHIYVVSAVYGSLVMISLAGGPALIPELVDESHLDTANALETLSYTLSGVVGPPIAGLLIPVISAPNVVALDALTYFAFAIALFSIRVTMHETDHAPQQAVTYKYRDALNLLVNNRILLSTTLMFMAANVGLGAMFVWLPILADESLGGGASLYGALLGVLAIGEVSSAFLAGTIKLPTTLGFSICMTQLFSGVALGLLAISIQIPIAVVALALLGFFSAPLTIWAQTLRMKVIPPELRGRTFALLRTMMQSTNPMGGAAAGRILPLVSLPVIVLLSAAIIGVPGLLGTRVRDLRTAD